MKASFEVPPTAGLPAQWSDWWPGRPRASLRPPGIEAEQIECSGTVALVVALRALQRLSPRRNVIVPAYTCPLVAIAIAHCGLRVRVCDTRPAHFDMDPDALATLCDDETLAIVPTHLGGRVADVSHAITCARAVGAWVIEDAAQAWGATANGTSVGWLGDIGFFSLAVGKGITLYEGGVLVARDPALREQMQRVSDATVRTRIGWEILRLAQLFAYTAFYSPRGLRWVYGMPRRRALARNDWVAAVGDNFSLRIPMHRVSAWRRQVGERSATRWPSFRQLLRTQALERTRQLDMLPGVRVMCDPPDTEGCWPFLLVHLPSASACDAVLAELASSPFGVSRLYVHALPDYEFLAPLLGTADVPNARSFAACTLTMSNSPWLDDAAFGHVIARIGAILDSISIEISQ